MEIRVSKGGRPPPFLRQGKQKAAATQANPGDRS